jgi:circadian clock protein KaiC
MSGGFTRGSLFLVEGNPGTGKTTMALRFLLEGAALGERNLYVTLSETKSELLSGAASHGWTLDSNIEVFELQPAERMLDADQQQSLLYSSELELGETVKLLLDTVERNEVNLSVEDLAALRAAAVDVGASKARVASLPAATQRRLRQQPLP